MNVEGPAWETWVGPEARRWAGKGLLRALTDTQQRVFTHYMRSENAWWLAAKCNELTTQEADALFFPGSGGKPHKAEAYCGDCPMKSFCLAEALQDQLQGFQAGTTESERRVMRRFTINTAEQLALRGIIVMPEEPVTRTVTPLRLIEDTRDRSWMDSESPDDAALKTIELFGNTEEAWESVV